MTNAQTNAKLFDATDAETKALILGHIAAHYRITPEQALAEVLDDDAEWLPDYMTGPARAATSLLMKRHGLD